MGLNITVAKIKIYNNCKTNIYSETGEYLDTGADCSYIKVIAKNEDIGWDWFRHVGDEQVYYDFLIDGAPIEWSDNEEWFRPKLRHLRYVRDMTDEILENLCYTQSRPRWKNLYDMIENNSDIWIQKY